MIIQLVFAGSNILFSIKYPAMTKNEEFSIEDLQAYETWSKYLENLPRVKTKSFGKLNIGTFFSGIGAVEQALEIQ